MRIKRLFPLIAIQIIVIVLLLLNLNQERLRDIKGVSVSFIESDQMTMDTESELEYFYEPVANLTLKTTNPYSDKVAVNNINKDSLNETRDYQVKKPDNTFRIITLGDSFTYGLYVDTENNYSEVLEKILAERCNEEKEYEVLNLGVQGYDMQYAVERFKIRGLKYEPDLVFWFLADPNKINEKMIPIIRNMVDSSEKNLSNDLWNMAATEIGKDGLKENHKRFLSEFRDLYKGRLVIATQPFYAINLNLSGVFKTYAQDNPLTEYFVITPLEREQNLFPDKHPNEAGHRVIAESIYDYLVKSSLVECTD